MNRKERRKLEKRKKMNAQTTQQPAVMADYLDLPDGQMPDGKALLGTMTGELFQPVRLYYQVEKPKMVLAAFRKLKCIEHVPEQGRWVWLYTKEASKIEFKKRPDVPDTPVVLGSFFMREDHKMYLDLRSIERLLAAIPFFDRFIPREAAKATYFSLVNRLFHLSENAGFSFDDYFDAKMAFEDPSEKMMHDLEALSERAQDHEEKMKLLDEYMAKRENAPIEDVEHLAVRYYDEGIKPLQLVLVTRQHVALQHWLGNMEYTKADFIHELVHRKLEEKD